MLSSLRTRVFAWRRPLPKSEKHDTASIAEELDFQRSSWKVQRVAWLIMVGVSLSALLGLFGQGPLSAGHAGSDQSGLRIDYERFLRREAPATLEVNVGVAALQPDSTAEIWIDRKWLAEMEIKRITPEPESSLLERDRIVYRFRLDPSSAPARITWYLETHALGASTGRIGVAGGPAYSFFQFAYP